MRIVNTEVFVPKTDDLQSEYFEDFLRKAGMNFLRWAIVSVGEKEYTLNVSHIVED